MANHTPPSRRRHPRSRISCSNRYIEPGRNILEFFVEFEINVPDGARESEVRDREIAEASAANKLADQGHLVRVWKVPVASGESRTLGLYRAACKNELDGLLEALPLYEWMDVTVTPLEPHPNDPAASTTPTSVKR